MHKYSHTHTHIHITLILNTITKCSSHTTRSPLVSFLAVQLVALGQSGHQGRAGDWSRVGYDRRLRGTRWITAATNTPTVNVYRYS